MALGVKMRIFHDQLTVSYLVVEGEVCYGASIQARQGKKEERRKRNKFSKPRSTINRAGYRIFKSLTSLSTNL